MPGWADRIQVTPLHDVSLARGIEPRDVAFTVLRRPARSAYWLDLARAANPLPRTERGKPGTGAASPSVLDAARRAFTRAAQLFPGHDQAIRGAEGASACW